jgi:hypothetical protein
MILNLSLKCNFYLRKLGVHDMALKIHHYNHKLGCAKSERYIYAVQCKIKESSVIQCLPPLSYRKRCQIWQLQQQFQLFCDGLTATFINMRNRRK